MMTKRVWISFYVGSNTQKHIIAVCSSKERATESCFEDCSSNWDSLVSQQELSDEVRCDYEVVEFAVDELADILSTPEELRG